MPAVASAAEDRFALEGSWTAQQRSDGRIQLHLSDKPRSSFGFSIPSAALERAGAERFVLEREAGSFVLQGRFDGRRGGGTFRFRPDETFREELVRRGLGRVHDRRQLELAAVDLTLAFIDELRGLGYDEPLDRLVEMRIHRAGPSYIRALRAAGYDGLPARRLVEMRIHSVTPGYIQELAAVGYEALPAKRLVEMRIHSVTPEYVRDLGKAGLDGATARELVEMKIHSVRPELVVRLKEHGRPAPTPREAIDLHIHGVTVDFVDALAELGYRDATPRQLVEMRIHGVSPHWLKDVLGRSQDRPPIRRLVEMRIHGGD